MRHSSDISLPGKRISSRRNARRQFPDAQPHATEPSPSPMPSSSAATPNEPPTSASTPHTTELPAPHETAPANTPPDTHKAPSPFDAFGQAFEAIEAFDRPALTKPEHEMGWLASLWQRLVSAIVLIPIVVALAFLGGWYAFAGGLVALALGAWELRAMFVHKGWRPHTGMSVALGVVFLLAAILPAYRLPLLYVGVCGVIIISFALFLWLQRASFEETLRDWALTLATPFYLGWPLALFVALRGATFGFGSRGFWWTVATCFMVWANDSAALLVGHFFGRTKLSPHISPAKTWEGFAGGLALTIAAAFVFTAPLHIAWYLALALGVAVTIAATIGDLAESLLKRGTGVKDSGTLIPGHGGLLDRMDSLLFGVMVVFCFAAFIDKLI